jgi:hypothetical protein
MVEATEAAVVFPDDITADQVHAIGHLFVHIGGPVDRWRGLRQAGPGSQAANDIEIRDFSPLSQRLRWGNAMRLI